MKINYKNESYTSDDWFYVPHEKKSKDTQLYCFHHAGGNSSFYREWTKYLPDNIELVAIDLPGRGVNGANSKVCLDHCSDIIATFIFDNRALPYSLFGHSMGANLAFLVAYKLKLMGSVAQHVFVSGCPAPNNDIVTRKPVSTMSEDELLEHIVSIDGLNGDVKNNSDILSYYLSIIRKDLSAIDECKINNTPAFEVDLTLMIGRQDRLTGKSDVSGWKDKVLGEFYVRGWEGGHFYLKNNVESVVQMISKTLQAYD